MATAKKHYARYYIVRGMHTMWAGPVAHTCEARVGLEVASGFLAILRQ